MAYFLNNFCTMSSLTFCQLFEIYCKLLTGCRTIRDRYFLFKPSNHTHPADTEVACSCMVDPAFGKFNNSLSKFCRIELHPTAHPFPLSV